MQAMHTYATTGRQAARSKTGASINRLSIFQPEVHNIFYIAHDCPTRAITAGSGLEQADDLYLQPPITACKAGMHVNRGTCHS